MEPNKPQKPQINFTYSQQAQQPVQQVKPVPIPTMKPEKPNKPKPQPKPYTQMNNVPQMQMQAPIQQTPMQQMAYQSNNANFDMPMQLNNNYGNDFEQNCNYIEEGPDFFGGGSNNSIKLLKEREKDKKVVAIIVSFCNGCSYDSLFTSVEQKTMEGCQTLVYACGAKKVEDFNKAFSEPPEEEIMKEFLANLKEVQPDCVVFNWECSGNYGEKTFTEGQKTVMEFLKKILDAGHMAMFSDFSLKALINQWDNELLGSNPFVQTGQTSSSIELRFKSGVLKECPSAQLQSVGELAEEGKCQVSTMSSTIIYSVDKQRIDPHRYQLEILTIACGVVNEGQHGYSQQVESYNNNRMKQVTVSNLPPLKIGEHQGTAGHVLLKYKTGGILLTSMGHWVELMKIDTSDKKLFEIAEREYGVEKATQMRQEYAQMDFGAQQAYVQRNAVEFVQNSAPCTNMYKKQATKMTKGKY